MEEPRLEDTQSGFFISGDNMNDKDIRRFLIPDGVLRDIIEGRDGEAVKKIEQRMKVLRKEHLSIVKEKED